MGIFGEQNNPHPSPPFKVGVLFVSTSTGRWNSSTTLHGGGRGGKALLKC